MLYEINTLDIGTTFLSNEEEVFITIKEINYNIDVNTTGVNFIEQKESKDYTTSLTVSLEGLLTCPEILKTIRNKYYKKAVSY